MAFRSIHAPRIWDDLYKVYIPDQLTLSPDYLSVYGTYVTGNKQIDEMLATNTTLVMIPIAKMLEYYEAGYLVEIPSRKDMLNIHKYIELYLSEWRDHIRFDINLNLESYRKMIFALEKMSKEIYMKAKPREVVQELLPKKPTFGLVNPIKEQQLEKEMDYAKPNYDGISSLVRNRLNRERR